MFLLIGVDGGLTFLTRGGISDRGLVQDSVGKSPAFLPPAPAKETPAPVQRSGSGNVVNAPIDHYPMRIVIPSPQ